MKQNADGLRYGDQNDTVESIGRILKARSVAVVGASDNPKKYGYMTLDSIIRGGYEGAVYPVNPKGGSILGLKAYPSVDDLPDPVDLVIVVIPAESVPGVLVQAGRRGARGVLIQSSGFREAGRRDLEEKLLTAGRPYGLRIMGPNIQGINYPPNKLCAMFFPVIKTPGPLAVVSQSGTVTAALSQWADEEGLGISAAINLGNQIDLCEADYLRYLVHDEHTKAVAMYLEGIQDGDRFLSAIAEIVPSKPVVVLKTGRTAAGRRSAASHTGALAGGDNVFDAVCRRFGIIRAHSLEDLYDAAKGLALMKPPRGRRLLTVSTSGGAGTIAVDEAASLGLHIPEPSADLVSRLREIDNSPLTVFSNPIDLDSLEAEAYQRVGLAADRSGEADVLLINFGDPVAEAPEAVRYLAGRMESSLAVAYLGGGDDERTGRVRMLRGGVSAFPSPERAILGINSAVRYAEFRRKTAGVSGLKEPGPNRSRVMPRRGVKTRFLPETDGIGIIRSYGIPYPEHGLARSEAEAAALADDLGYPVVLKVVSRTVSHKSDVGGVAVGLTHSDQVRDAYRDIVKQVAAAATETAVDGVLVCRQAPPGLEVIIGAVVDPVFGPAVMFGLGGIYTEIFKDVSFRLAPLEREAAEEMVREVKGGRIIQGMRGREGYDEGSLVEAIMAVAVLIAERSDITEMDLNPVRVFDHGLLALDVRIVQAIKD